MMAAVGGRGYGNDSGKNSPFGLRGSTPPLLEVIPFNTYFRHTFDAANLCEKAFHIFTARGRDAYSFEHETLVERNSLEDAHYCPANANLVGGK